MIKILTDEMLQDHKNIILYYINQKEYVKNIFLNSHIRYISNINYDYDAEDPELEPDILEIAIITFPLIEQNIEQNINELFTERWMKVVMPQFEFEIKVGKLKRLLRFKNKKVRLPKHGFYFRENSNYIEFAQFARKELKFS